ncbi:hypothetical protein MCOR27_000701 [Pyricularia oryzae]|uniref:High affinity methionine permease n=2 Tax=Pyricularia TaxID=48558 RepID=A0ABQ8NDB2_PYRGI|nr:hypothetical protein MCOR02_007037 [Pyricularia oryzae]KAI6295227.1 hypothetical protein MCOR33_007846 [Pyricularia grisea]KAI6258254.1 hypothetical protein MCOR19_005352 [Pyricularia oryzae]KAI6277859.1 hypothetical protein MCOR26_004934 [Pyricularia oryzae]KAI6288885.1 hypothetical protein MCOR27_000701 [Pyricularia oryzae]
MAPHLLLNTGITVNTDLESANTNAPTMTNTPQDVEANSLDCLVQSNGAVPVETNSPMGQSVGPFTVVMLNIGNIIGIGVFSTSSSILKGTGSVGMSMIYWTIGIFIAASHLAVFLEFACYFPKRSGSLVVFLEQSYPKPRYLFPIMIALVGLILGFGSSMALVLAKYLFQAVGHTYTTWELKGLAVAGYTAVIVLLTLSNRVSYWVINVMGVIKIATLAFISVAGLLVLGGRVPNIPDPLANFRDPFSGTATAYGLTNALVKIIFSYAGSGNGINVQGELKKPGKSLRNMEFLALGATGILFVLTNLAFFAAIPKNELENSTEIAAGMFFRRVFGDSGWVRGLNVLIALCTLGSIVSTTLGLSRMTRESGRQGVIPWTRFWASTRPFGTPLGPYAWRWALTTIMILAVPSGDAFNFMVDLQMYPGVFFELALNVGLVVVRARRSRQHAPRPEFRAWNVALMVNTLASLAVIVMPWYPPDGGPYAGDVSFWYATYAAAGVGVLVVCALYYLFKIHLMPRWGGYVIRDTTVMLQDNVQTNMLVKVPLGKLASLGEACKGTPSNISSEPNNGKD